MKRFFLLPALILIPAIWGCADKKTVHVVPAETGKVVVAVQADNFSFNPAIIKAGKGDFVMLRMTNTTAMEHNVTVNNPVGQKVLTIDLPAKETVEIPLQLVEAGTWEFYCDKPFHPSLGMTGRIETYQR
ncbi:MAG: plastocyanin/azurin family copper-binding protein [Syntrophotaleaceae bacterium]